VADLGLHVDPSVVVAGDPVANGEPEAGSFADFLRRDERFEDVREEIARDSDAFISDPDPQESSRRFAAVGGGRCLDVIDVHCEFSALGHRVNRVHEEVGHDLLQPARVSFDHVGSRAAACLDSDVGLLLVHVVEHRDGLLFAVASHSLSERVAEHAAHDGVRLGDFRFVPRDLAPHAEVRVDSDDDDHAGEKPENQLERESHPSGTEYAPRAPASEGRFPLGFAVLTPRSLEPFRARVASVTRIVRSKRFAAVHWPSAIVVGGSCGAAGVGVIDVARGAPPAGIASAVSMFVAAGTFGGLALVMLALPIVAMKRASGERRHAVLLSLYVAGLAYFLEQYALRAPIGGEMTWRFRLGLGAVAFGIGILAYVTLALQRRFAIARAAVPLSFVAGVAAVFCDRWVLVSLYERAHSVMEAVAFLAFAFAIGAALQRTRARRGLHALAVLCGILLVRLAG
jgi:hypothetical protein